jgi:polyisoprenoid-binding protein YceI
VPSWIFEPGHTEAEFRARHMMVTWVRGLFKDIHGRLDFDLDDCMGTTFEGKIDAPGIWTGEPARDEHLRSADFLDVENHPEITFKGPAGRRRRRQQRGRSDPRRRGDRGRGPRAHRRHRVLPLSDRRV